MKKAICLLLFALLTYTSIAQYLKKPLDHYVYDQWNSIKSSQISNNGRWVAYVVKAHRGDGVLCLYNAQTKVTDSFARGSEPLFSPTSQYLVFKIEPQFDTVRAQKLRKVKEDKLPKDTLAVYLLDADSLILFPAVKNMKLPDKNSPYLTALFDKSPDLNLPETDTLNNNQENPAAEIPVKDSKKSKKKEVESSLMILNPVSGDKRIINHVDEYSLSKNGAVIAYTQVIRDSADSTSVFVFETGKKKEYLVFAGTSEIKKLTVDQEGKQLAFLKSSDSTEQKWQQLYVWQMGNKYARMILDTMDPLIPEQMKVSINRQPYFSEDGKRLFFGLAEKTPLKEKDTLLEDEKYHLDIWSWTDKKLQSQQINDLEKDKKKSYLAFLQLDSKKLMILENQQISKISMNKKGQGNVALGFSNDNYLKSYSWKSSQKYDVFLMDLEKGTAKKVLEGEESTINLSPAGKYILWYDTDDSCWHTMNNKSGEKIKLTRDMKSAFYDELSDVPSAPNPYGFAGWTKDDKNILIYDRYDVWMMDPQGQKAPVNLTANFGRVNQNRIRYISIDPELEYIDINSKNLFKVINEESKGEGFLWADKGFIFTQVPNFSDCIWGSILKAKDTHVFIFTRENFATFPDLWLSGPEFDYSRQISYVNPQQKDYLWGSVEIIHWKDLAGEQKGLLYKPENFDPAGKYPMIVYFYEKYTDALNRHYPPVPSRSIINFPLYTSNGYLVFIPDITFKTGYPGESALRTVISGTENLVAQGFVDDTKIGLQGQSWGGYLTAFIITQTDVFKCAMAGAVVSNMTSAYGAIRWESGLSRMFQYEEGQSRIGTPFYENPDLYVRNSPLFYAKNIVTPLLMMHNDKDGAVPWSQGIELFTLLRRLDKTVWMLTYNNEEHNLTKWPNRMDLSIRMMQFFDHYLKDKPAPEWMLNGIPAVRKDTMTGYELINDVNYD